MADSEIPEKTHLGRYRIKGRLGRGGMGVVYAGEDEVLKREVAIKVLSDEAAFGAQARERFLLEARAAARLNHPNVVTVHDVGVHEGRVYIVMELVPGESAQVHLRSLGALPWREATRVVAEVCRGLAAAHTAGLIHRDIKPSNILLGAGGVVKLSDFGLAKAPALVSGRLTQAGEVLGTPQFMSPEHCSDQPLDERTDIYSLGATYYALLVGRPPYDSPDVVKVLYAHCSAPVPDPCSTVPGIPAGCAAVVSRAMARSRTARFRTALEMAAALEALLADTVPVTLPVVAPIRPVAEPTGMPTPGAPEKLPRAGTGRRRQVGYGLGGAGLVGVCALLTALFWPVRETTAPGRATEGAQVAGPARDVVLRSRVNPLPGGHTGAVTAVSVAGGRIASVGDDATARLWSADGGAPTRVISHPAALLAVALSPDGIWLATGGLRNTVFLWNAATGEKLGEFPTGAPVHALAFSPSGKQLAAGTGYDLTLLEVLPTLRLRARLLTNHYKVASVGYSADGRYLVACTYQKQVHRWDVGTLAEKKAGNFSQELVSVSVSADGSRVAVAAREGVYYFWHPDAGGAPALHENTRTGITALAFVPGRTALMTAGEWGGVLRLRDPGAGTTRTISSGASKAITAVSFAADGRLLAAGCSEGSVRLWDVVPTDGPRN